MNITRYIDLTNEEYEKNGISELFIKAQNTIISTQNGDYIFKFAHKVKGADVDLLQDAIIKTGDIENIIDFGAEVDGIDALKISRIVAKHAKSIPVIYECAHKIKGADIPLLQDAIINIANTNMGNSERDGKYIIKFAQDIEGADITKLEDAIIKTDSATNMFDFAYSIKGANIVKLEDAIIKTGDAGNIFYFARFIKGSNIEKLQEALIETRNLDYIIKFAKDIKCADIEKLQDVLIAEAKKIYRRGERGYDDYIIKFAEEVEGANILKLQNAIQNDFYKFAYRLENKGADIFQLYINIVCKKEGIDIIHFYKEFKEQIPSSKISQEKLKNVELAYNLATKTYYKDGKLCWACSVGNIKEVQDFIIESGNTKYIFGLAQSGRRGINIKELEDAIIKTNNIDYIWAFSKLPGANVQRLRNEYENIANSLERMVKHVEDGQITLDAR